MGELLFSIENMKPVTSSEGFYGIVKKRRHFEFVIFSLSPKCEEMLQERKIRKTTFWENQKI
jgi:hypothetical protein